MISLRSKPVFSAKRSDVGSIIVLPDTQNMTVASPTMLSAMSAWCRKQSAAAIIHVGDMVNDDLAAQWETYRDTFYPQNVPLIYASGNHEYSTNPSVRTSLASSYISPPTGAVLFSPGDVFNFYLDVQIGSKTWRIITTEFGARNDVVTWAAAAASATSNNCILVHHAWLYTDGTIYDWAVKGAAQNWNPFSYTAQLPIENDAKMLWDKFVSTASNIKLVFCGHVLNANYALLTSTRGDGSKCHQIMGNWQETSYGNGWLRWYEIDNVAKTITIETYSPHLNQYSTRATLTF